MLDIAHTVLQRDEDRIAGEHRSQLRKDCGGHPRFDEKNDCLECRALQRGGTAGRLDTQNLRTFAGYSQSGGIDRIHMRRIGIEDRHLGHRCEARSEQAADGAATNDEHMGIHADNASPANRQSWGWLSGCEIVSGIAFQGSLVSGRAKPAIRL